MKRPSIQPTLGELSPEDRLRRIAGIFRAVQLYIAAEERATAARRAQQWPGQLRSVRPAILGEETEARSTAQGGIREINRWLFANGCPGLDPNRPEHLMNIAVMGLPSAIADEMRAALRLSRADLRGADHRCMKQAA